MTQRDRDRQNQERFERDRNRPYDRQQNQRQDDDWARQVPWDQGRNPYGDYGWERHESSLPEFRDPDIHVQPYERQQVSRYRKVNWNRDYNYGIEQEGPYSGIGPKGYQRSDERIFEDVCERLTRHGQIDARGIEVKVNNGEVTLTGSVDSRQTKRMAEDVAENVRGVRDVHNQMHVMQQGYRQDQANNQSGMPGGGQGRVDEVGRSGVYPVSGPRPDQNAPVRGEAGWGQGDRGSAGYQDSGQSELSNPRSSNPSTGQPSGQSPSDQGKPGQNKA